MSDFHIGQKVLVASSTVRGHDVEATVEAPDVVGDIGSVPGLVVCGPGELPVWVAADRVRPAPRKVKLPVYRERGTDNYVASSTKRMLPATNAVFDFVKEIEVEL